MKRDQFVSLCFLALLVFVVYQVFWIFSPFFKAIFWSAILAFTFYPVYEKVRNNPFKIGETGSALLMTVIIVLVVIPPLIYIIINMAAQAVDLYQTASDYIRTGGLESFIERLRSLSYIQSIEERIFEWEPLKRNVSEWLLSTARSIGNFTAAQAGTITKNIFFIILNLILMFFLIFVFLRDGEKIYGFIYQIAPLEEQNKRPIFRRINETLSAVIRGQILTSFTQAVVAGTAFWLLGLPIPIFFGALIFIAGMIPVVGASSVWLPLAFYLLIVQEYVRAGILFVFGFLVISLIDNFMKPALIGEKTKLPYFLLCFGILGGLKVYGIIGIFLAPVVLSLFFVLVKIYQEKNW
jgi:predicted PurR-regulated permease PerM